MSELKIGVILDSFRVGFSEGLKCAARVGAQGVQMYTVEGELAPENLSAARRKEMLGEIRSCGLSISAIVGDLGGHGFQIEGDNPEKIERTKRILDLAVDLEIDVVTTHIGVLPKDKAEPKWQVMHDACKAIGEYGKSVGVRIAIETGPEPSEVLGAFLDAIGSDYVKVNYDPANLAMVIGEDAAQGVYNLKNHIVHTHAKDGVMKKKTDPAILYGIFAGEGVGSINLHDYFEETPLGEGDVDFAKWIAALEDIGYEGFLTIEREVGSDPYGDIERAVVYLKSILGE